MSFVIYSNESYQAKSYRQSHRASVIPCSIGGILPQLSRLFCRCHLPPDEYASPAVATCCAGHLAIEMQFRSGSPVLRASRPAVSEKRLSQTSAGNIRYQLKTPYSDGTTHVAVLAHPCASRHSCAPAHHIQPVGFYCKTGFTGAQTEGQPHGFWGCRDPARG